MKKLLCTICMLLLLIPAAGCKLSQKEIFFYYPRKEVVYGQAEGFIAREERDVSGMESDLQDLLMLYLEGPLSQALRSPFPKGTTVTQLEIQNAALVLTLSESFAELEGLERTVACASIARTCFGLGAFEEITITSGDTVITLTPNTISLIDNAVITNPA